MPIYLSDLYPDDPGPIGPSGATGPQGATGPIPENVVFTTGDQTISGLKDFATRPTVNTIPVALSGEAASNIEQFVKNDSNTTLFKGQPVYVSGSNGNNILIHPASNSGEGTSSKTFGLLKQTLLNNEQGYVVTEGALLNVDTSIATEGDPVWLGPTGNLIYGLANKPKAPQHLVSLGFVERAHQNQGKIFVKVQNGFELEELHNVRIVNEQNSDIIIYNSGSGLWLNSGVNFGNFYTRNNPSGFISNQGVVFTTGDQTINGVKNFTGIGSYSDRSLQYNGTGVLVQGEAAPIQRYVSINQIPSPYYLISGYPQILNISTSTATGGNLILPNNLTTNSIVEIQIPPTSAQANITIFVSTLAYTSSVAFTSIQGGNGKGGYIKLGYYGPGAGSQGWSVFPFPAHASNHSQYSVDPILAKDVGAVPELSNYYTNKLDADVSIGGSGIYETNSQLNGKSYWTCPIGDSAPSFAIGWDNTNNSWKIGTVGFGITFVRSFHDVPEPYMATGWQGVGYGAQLRSIRRLPYIDITNQNIQGNLLIDGIYANSAEIKSSLYYLFSNNGITLTDQVINLANSTTGITVYLPAVTSGRNYTIKNINIGTVTITGSNTIDNSGSINISQNESANLLGINSIGYTGWITI